MFCRNCSFLSSLNKEKLTIKTCCPNRSHLNSCQYPLINYLKNNLELVKKSETETMPPAIDNNKKQTDCAENKKNCPNTTTTTTNNGVIKVSMVGEIAMSNFHNHQCK